MESDTPSDADVQAMLDGINGLTGDLAFRAAGIAREPVKYPNPHKPADYQGFARRAIGDTFTSVLHSLPKGDDAATILLQFAWQTIILGEVHRILAWFWSVHKCQKGERLLRTLSDVAETQGG